MRQVAAVMFVLVALVGAAVADERPAPGEDGLVELSVRELVFDRASGAPVMLLEGRGRKDVLIPIWIGLCEARAIELARSGAVAPRPLTYDMVAAFVHTTGASVERVVIVDLRDGVYYAEIHLGMAGSKRVIDARPSDAVALAVRLGAPIYAVEQVIEKAVPEGRRGKQGA